MTAVAITAIKNEDVDSCGSASLGAPDCELGSPCEEVDGETSEGALELWLLGESAGAFSEEADVELVDWSSG